MTAGNDLKSPIPKVISTLVGIYFREMVGDNLQGPAKYICTPVYLSICRLISQSDITTALSIRGYSS